MPPIRSIRFNRQRSANRNRYPISGSQLRSPRIDLDLLTRGSRRKEEASAGAPLRGVREDVPRQDPSTRPSADAHRGEAVRVRAVREEVQQAQSSQHSSARSLRREAARLREVRHLYWRIYFSTSPTPEKNKKKKKVHFKSDHTQGFECWMHAVAPMTHVDVLHACGDNSTYEVAL